MALRVGLNGIGRIGRCLIRLLRTNPEVQITAINDLADIETAVHLIRHDSIHGAFPGQIAADGPERLILDGRVIPYSRHAAPAEIPWARGEVTVVVEATGRFSGNGRARDHLGPQVGRVLVTAVSGLADRQIILGVDEPEFPSSERVVALGSCTTHAAAVPLHLLDTWFGVRAAEMTTVHCTTGSQMTMDGPHPDLRRARCALVSMIPTTTSAQAGLARALPHLADHLTCLAIRVPTASVSLVELVVRTREKVDAPCALGTRFREAAAGRWEGILSVSDTPLVSADFRGDPHSSIIDLPLIARAEPHMVRLVAWYDNEWGYSSRIADLLRLLGENAG